ncbi:hypothetical protein NESM_000656100 [Novymonas esmeraldas]|uniref:Wings apart-like protein C-terminal domain-containing protein n=1 Tax=Novymonas esmeraldas TaxID=1808958 RepID=A0AAW0ES89_9TRYP
MASKRPRTHAAFAGNSDVDEDLRALGTRSASASPAHWCDDDLDDIFAEVPLRGRARTSESSTGISSRGLGSTSPSSPRAMHESIGGDEVDVLRRKDEEVADMALFLATTVGETSSRTSLVELVDLLEQRGVQRVVLALRRAGGLGTFVARLHRAASFSDADRRVAVALFFFLMNHVDAEALLHESVVGFLVHSLGAAEPSRTVGIAAAPASAAPAAERATPHWSTRARRRTAGPQTQYPLTRSTAADGLEGRVEALCGSAAPTRSGDGTVISCAALALRSLLTLLFAYNGSHLHASAPQGHSVPLLFARTGGLERVAELLCRSDTRESALSLLEVLTATDALSLEGARLPPLVPALVALLSAGATCVPALKVLTNITNIVPDALAAGGAIAPFAEFALQSLSHAAGSGAVDEGEVFVLCCAINVVKYESRESGAAAAAAGLASALLASDTTLASLARTMVESYGGTSTEQLVRSGYYALLLGALSLVAVATADGHMTMRVPVMTAVARASGDTSMGRRARHQPMRIVLAIAQEFLLFQSSAGTLTKAALADAQALLDRILRCNGITAATDSCGGVEGETALTTAADVDEDDMLIGQLLQ